jgi:2-hydroxycyclohexanecarboxyl-CoA dehydrogenase
MRDLNGKVAVITGAAGGIGRALCQRFCEEGASVLALDLSARVEELRLSLQSLAPRLTPFQVDVTDRDALEKLVDAAIKQFGKVDILVNNVGWDLPKPFIDTNPELWHKLIDLNLMGSMHLQHLLLPHMIEKGGGKIVNIASDAGRVGAAGEAVYSACKGGLIALSKSLAREYARKSIRVNVVCPGPTDTALLESFKTEGAYGQRIYDGLLRSIPLRRLAEPADISGIVAFLSSSDADYITGQVISVSGGLTMHG